MLTVQSMSLRDWFAGQALQAIVSQQDYSKMTLGTPIQLILQETAKRSYELADAMLKARGPGEPAAMETPAPVLTPRAPVDGSARY